MANWEQFRQYIKSNYKVREDSGDVLTLVFDVGANRSQIVVLEKQGFKASDSDWVSITSPIGKVAGINLTVALMKAGEYVVGGLTIEGDFLIAKHSVPLANVDGNEIEEPLRVLTMMADQLESELVGGDAY